MGDSASGHRPGQTLSPVSPLQLLANAIIFLCGNLTGAFHKHQMQDASRDLFTYTVKCIQTRRKLRIEKRQQVGHPQSQSVPAQLLELSPRPTPCILSPQTSCAPRAVCVGCVAGHPRRPHHT